ncbi:MAG: cobalamin biosynthesis protein [Pseudomonadota bacterium]
MIVAGFGFRNRATADSLADALELAAGELSVTHFATASDKATGPVFREFAARCMMPVARVEAEDLKTQETLTKSSASARERGTGSLAEAAALAAAGPGARLLVARVVSPDGFATCALAQGAQE